MAASFKFPSGRGDAGTSRPPRPRQFARTAAWVAADVWTKDRHILKIAPEHARERHSTCVKGKFGWGHINSGDRLTTPLIRKQASFARYWGEALNFVTRQAVEIKAKNDPTPLRVHLLFQMHERKRAI